MSSQSDPRLDQVQRLVESEQFEDARVLLLGVLRENPRDTRALFLYALAANNRDEAIKVLNRVLELDPLHEQAKNVLAQIEGRSVAPPPPPPPQDVVPPSPSGVSAPPRRRSGYDPSLLLAMAAVVVIIGAAIAVLIAFGSEDTGDSDQPAAGVVASATPRPSNTPTITNTPDLIRQATFEAASEATLPVEWTASPTTTDQPTRTPGPTFEVQPTRTTLPTFTPTQPEVTLITIDFTSFQRLFNEYYELSAQVTSVNDSRSLNRIAVAISTIIESIEQSNYDSVENDPLLVSYAEEFLELLDREQAVAEKRAEIIDLQDDLEDASGDERSELESQLEDATEDLDGLLIDRLEQLEFVEATLRSAVAEANATAAFIDGIDRLRTPTSTPIVVPAPPSNDGS